MGITLKVMTGDVVNIYGSSFYHLNTGQAAHNNYPITAAVNNLIGAFAATPAVVTGLHGATAAALENTAVAPTPGELTGLLNTVPTPTANMPKAYINWVLFDGQFNVYYSFKEMLLASKFPKQVSKYVANKKSSYKDKLHNCLIICAPERS